MPDRDYTKIFDEKKPEGIQDKDYSELFVGKPKQNQPIVDPLSYTTGTEQFEERLTRTRRMLLDQGHPEDAIDSMLTPLGKLPSGMDLTTLWDSNPDNDVKILQAIAEAQKVEQQMGKEGLLLGPIDSINLQKQMIRLGEKTGATLTNLSSMRQWWTDMKQQVGDETAEFISGGALNLSLGLSLLDVAIQIDKFAKLGVLRGTLEVGKKLGRDIEPVKQIHDLEEEILPIITLKGPEGEPQEFISGTSAAMWIIAQRTWGFGERNFATVPSAVLAFLSKKTGLEPLEEFFSDINRRITETGEQRSTFAVGQIPPLTAARGRIFDWQEVAERSFNPEDVDSVYRTLEDHGFFGDVAALNIAFRFAVGDLLIDPFLIGGTAVTAIPKALRAAVPVGKAAKITEEIARRTYRFDDAIDAVKAAEKHFEQADAKVSKEVLESVQAVGKAKVKRDTYARMILARRQLNRNKQWLDTFKDPTENEILLRTPRRNPKQLPAPPKEFPDEVGKDLQKFRKDELELGHSGSPQWDEADVATIQQRSVFGPDDVEQGGDGMAMMIRTGGLGVDDIKTTPVAPEYMVTPSAGPVPLINWKNRDASKAIGEASKNFINSLRRGLPETPGQPVYDLQNSSMRLLAHEEDVLRRALGAARSGKAKDDIKFFEKHLSLNREAQKQLSKGLTKDANKFDDVWLPGDQPTIMGNPLRYHRWLDAAGDRVVKSLYPGGLQFGYWDSMFGRLHGLTREPQRFFEVYDPATWDKVRGSYLRYHQTVKSWSEMITQDALDAGVLVARKTFDRVIHFSKYKVDETKNLLLFELLDLEKGTDAWNKLARQADDKLLTMHDRIRETFEIAADIQGISGTDRSISRYISHVFDRTMVSGGARPLEFVGIPKKVELFASHLMRRSGKEGYKKDAMAALELYGRAMPRKTILEPMYQDLLAKGGELAKKHNMPAMASYVNDFVLQLQGKPTVLGAKLDDFIGSVVNAKGGLTVPFVGGKTIPEQLPLIGGRTIPKKLKWVPNAIDRALMGIVSFGYMGMLTGNPRYAVMQFTTAIPTTSARFGMFRTFRGLAQMATREGQALAKQAGVYQPFIDLLESPFFRRVSKFLAEKGYTITPFGVMTNAKAEESIRGMTFWAAIDMHLSKMGLETWAQAVNSGFGKRILFDALRSSEEVNHLFGALGRSPALTRTFLGSQGAAVAATQFLSFIWKQSDELLSQFSRDPSRILEYLAASGWISRVAAQNLGIDLTSYTGLGYLPEEPSEFTSPAVDALTKMVEHASAHSSRDPERISRANRDLLDAADNLIPYMAGFESAGKAIQRTSEKEIKTRAGEKLFEMDFTVSGPTTPSGLGGQLLPTIFAQKDIREGLFRRGQRAIRQERKRFYFNMRKAVRDYIVAEERGNAADAEKALKELEDVYRIRLTSADPFIRLKQAREISWTLRQVDPALGADPQLLDRYIETMERFGMEVRQ